MFDTPNQKKEESRTGRNVSEPVGDSVPVRSDKSVSKKAQPDSQVATNVPKGVNKDVWEQAEHSAKNMGGLAGVDEKGRQELIQRQYDQLIQNHKDHVKWAGGSEVLGDVK